MHACVYVCTHIYIHIYVYTYTCCTYVRAHHVPRGGSGKSLHQNETKAREHMLTHTLCGRLQACRTDAFSFLGAGPQPHCSESCTWKASGLQSWAAFNELWATFEAGVLRTTVSQIHHEQLSQATWSFAQFDKTRAALPLLWSSSPPLGGVICKI